MNFMKKNKSKKVIITLSIVLSLTMAIRLKHNVVAIEPQSEESVIEQSYYVNFTSAEENFSEGLLDIPEKFQEEFLLYKWVAEAVEQYMVEMGKSDIFVCDLKKNLLYGGNEFILVNHKQASYEYPITIKDEIHMGQDSYKLKLEGEDDTLYLDIDIENAKVSVYATEDLEVISGDVGYVDAYREIVRDEEGQILYYPDTYVQSDWEDFERVDDHFAGVSFDELGQLEYLKIPEDSMEYYAVVNLNVAGVLKRYLEENQIDDVFSFDAEEDVIAHVTNMIYTCRVRGTTMTLYIDIDGYNMKAHVYQVED